jgi:hypothetical protein
MQARWWLSFVAMTGVALGWAVAQDSQPATGPDGRRTPKQVDLLRDLLRERERPAPIIPSRERTAAQTQRRTLPGLGARDPQLLPDGAMIVERPARLLVDEGRPRLLLTLPGEDQPRSLELNRNEWLEALERAASGGTGEFVITAEVSVYRGANFLLLRKVLERVPNGNLAP